MTVLTLDYRFDFMQQPNKPANSGQAESFTIEKTMSIGGNTNSKSSMGKRPGKRPGRKPSKIDERAKLERSRQSARECRARKKLRYQYLEELVLTREKAVFALRDELEMCKNWCTQLDRGGPVPDAVLKMIVNEDMKMKQRQQEQSKRSLQQQKQLQQRQISTSSSSSSPSSPPSLMEQQLNLLQQELSQKTPSDQQGASQSTFTQITSSAQSAQGFSTPLQQHQVQHHPQQQQILHKFQQRQSTVPAPLKRQMAFDQSPQQGPSQARFVQATHTGQQQLQLQLQEQLKQQQQRNSGYGPSGTASTSIQQTQPSQSSQPQHNLMVPRTQNMMLSRVKSEPPLRYTPSLGNVNTYSSFGPDNSQGFGSRLLGNEGTRARSLSNPVTMVPLSRMNPSYASSSNMSTLQETQILSAATRQRQSQTLGLFSGTNIPSISMPQAITIEDSSSSDENISEQNLFQSTLGPQKRTLSDPIIQNSPKRIKQAVTVPQPMSSVSSSETTLYDPHATLSDLTTVHCFSATGTSNTSSPSSFQVVPANSPSSLSKKSNTTPSSSTSASPAPLSSLSSFLDLCPSPAVPLATETTAPLTTSVSVPSTVQCTTTGLSASIAEPIPEWYSFLADLEDGGHATLTSRHGASSNHSTPLALTPKQIDQPDTPDPSYMNVPTIIDELLDGDPTL